MRLAHDAMALARAHPTDAVVDALRFVVETELVLPGQPTKASEEAMRLLANGHTRGSKMGEFCQNLRTFFLVPITESLMRAVLEQNPDHWERGLACFGLAIYLQSTNREVQ